MALTPEMEQSRQNIETVAKSVDAIEEVRQHKTVYDMKNASINRAMWVILIVRSY